MPSMGFGGDPEGYMEAPSMSHTPLTEMMGGGFGGMIANILDLVGIHRQVAKGPKEPSSAVAAAATQPTPVVPQVITDVESALIPQEAPILPISENAPMTTWGQRWIQSVKPLTSIDPNTGR